jgi:hypothetical protein
METTILMIMALLRILLLTPLPLPLNLLAATTTGVIVEHARTVPEAKQRATKVVAMTITTPVATILQVSQTVSSGVLVVCTTDA